MAVLIIICKQGKLGRKIGVVSCWRSREVRKKLAPPKMCVCPAKSQPWLESTILRNFQIYYPCLHLWAFYWGVFFAIFASKMALFRSPFSSKLHIQVLAIRLLNNGALRVKSKHWRTMIGGKQSKYNQKEKCCWRQRRLTYVREAFFSQLCILPTSTPFWAF